MPVALGDLLGSPQCSTGDTERLRRLIAAVRADPTLVDRTANGEHITASAFVFNRTRTRTLLVHHAKAGVWVQPGGHLDPDLDLTPRDAALRELAEETGLTTGTVDLEPSPWQLIRFSGEQAFGTCRAHHDLTYLAVADPDVAVLRSPESHAVQWFPMTELPQGISADLPDRLRRAARAR